MTRAWTYALVATMAFGAGLVFALVAFDAAAPPADTARTRSERASPERATETERTPPRKRRHATPGNQEHAAPTDENAAVRMEHLAEVERAMLERCTSPAESATP